MPSARNLFVWAALAVCFGMLRPDVADLTPPGGRMHALPARTLWVWERPENLSSLDPRETAIATLDRTLVLGHGVAAFIPRRQSYLYPAGTTRIAVVRIEAPGAIDTALEPEAADLILDVLTPSPAALQIDFDARRSQREFYTALLHDLRRRMPAGMPLSITALASWCSNDDWIGRLPVDEAVPMLFRMEPDRRFAPPDLPWFRIREPLCEGSVGISTHEPSPVSAAGKRVYIFADRGWRNDLPLVAQALPPGGTAEVAPFRNLSRKAIAPQPAQTQRTQP